MGRDTWKTEITSRNDAERNNVRGRERVRNCSSTIRCQKAKITQKQIDIALAKQKERAATAELSLLELQKKLNWRELSTDQRNKFLAASIGKRKGLVTIMSVSSDPEARVSTDKLKLLLHTAGWVSPPVQTGLFITPNDLGLHINMTASVAPMVVSETEVSIPNDSPIAYGFGLKVAFNSSGFNASGGLNKVAEKNNAVLLVVGSRP